MAAVPGVVWTADTDAPESRVDTEPTEQAMAQPPAGSFTRSGFYLGIWLGRAWVDTGSSDDFIFKSDPGPYDNDYYDPDDASAIAVRGGFRFGRHIAGEIEYVTTDEFDDSRSYGGGARRRSSSSSGP
jgi:opacity protein-like surface antigen